MIILCDQDGVLADFENAFLLEMQKRHPNVPTIPIAQRTTFRLKEQYPVELTNIIENIYSSKGFFLSFEPIPGSIEALQRMQKKGHDVYICTSPLSESPPCYTEKYQWVLKHLGKDWARRLIITKDKTLVYGHLLIDDRPEISGLITPSWEHVIYSQPYNQNTNGKRRLTWDQDWESILKI